MPESFIIWQPGSAVQFYLLAAGKRSTACSPHSKQERKREGDGDKERERERQWKAAFHAKTTSGVIHGHAWAPVFLFCALPSAPPSLSSAYFIFWCGLAPEVKCLSLYNVQQRIARSDGDVESKEGEMCAGEAEQSDLWCPPLIFGRKRRLAGIIARLPKTAAFSARRLRRLRRRFQSAPATRFARFLHETQTQHQHSRLFYLCLPSVFLVKLQNPQQQLYSVMKTDLTVL